MATTDPPTTDPSTLPPPFRPQPIAAGDPFAVACAEAARGAEAGTLVWAARRDRLDMAVVLGPDRPLDETRRIVAVAMAALADALEALGPPNLTVGFGWPDRLLVNGALVGGLRFAAAPGAAGAAIPETAIPDWAVVGATVDVAGDPDDPDPGRHPERSALREEGFGDIEAPALLESVARHLLSWLDLWEDAGFEAVERIWRRRLDRPAALSAPGPALEWPNWEWPNRERPSWERPSWELPERRVPWTGPNG